MHHRSPDLQTHVLQAFPDLVTVGIQLSCRQGISLQAQPILCPRADNKHFDTAPNDVLKLSNNAAHSWLVDCVA